MQPEPGFPYETVIILSEIAKSGGFEAVRRVAHDARQNSTVRMICLLALYRAGYPYETEPMFGLLASETDLERRLILLLSLRWGGEQATATLLKNLEDPNAEIATAAACALVDVQPPEAIPKLKRLLQRNYDNAPLMLLNAAAAFKSAEGREVLENALVEALEGKRNSRHLSRILDAFVDAWDVPRNAYRRQDDDDYERQAHLALAFCRERSQREQAERQRLSSAVESLRTQLRIAQEIEALRRAEYKRLLKLQGDDIVTAEESQRAHEHLQSVSNEVESLKATLRERESLLNTLNKKTR
jgi:HEAT repeat protein